MYCRISEPGCADEFGRCPHVCDCVYKSDIPSKKTIKMYIDRLNALFKTKDERIFRLERERHWKDRRIRELEAENEKLKEAIRNQINPCEICKGYDEKNSNYGYTEFCEDCFWYPWSDEEKCPNKWEMKE